MVRCIALVAFLVAILNTVAFAAGPAGYARPELLVEADQLKAELDRLAKRPLQQARQVTGAELAERGRGEFVLVDVRPRASYDQGTLPNALHVDAREWATGFRGGRDPLAWSRRVNRLAFPGPKTTIVVFDNGVTPSAARVWWLLKYWGFEDARLLNGGVAAWRAAGGLLAIPRKHSIEPGNARRTPDPNRLATREEVQRAIAGQNAFSTCLVDTRSDAEVVAGKIPTSKHSDWTRYVDPKTGRLRPAAELKGLLDATGFDPQRPAIAYCRTGGRASVVVFVMELMGGEQVANYYGSWNDWSRANKQP